VNDDLTPYQQRLAHDSARSGRRMMTETSPADRPAAEAAITKLRQVSGMSGAPLYIWVSSPKDYVDRLTATLLGTQSAMNRLFYGRRSRINLPESEYHNREFAALHVIGHAARIAEPLISDKQYDDAIKQNVGCSTQLNEFLLKSEGGQLRLDKIWTAAFYEEHVPARRHSQNHDSDRLLALPGLNRSLKHEDIFYSEIVKQAFRSCACWWNFEQAVFVCERPSIVSVDDGGRLHSTHGPAFEWRDGGRYYSICGIAVEPELFERGRIAFTLDRLNKERNAEVRRVLIELYGPEKYLREIGAKVIHHGRDCRRLWRAPNAPDMMGEALVMVELVNSTPEPDGSHKVYFLRVDPRHTNADEAVAATFRLTKEIYLPVRET
jgi:hypothetical protein